MMDPFESLPSMPSFQKKALIVHAINLHKGFKCTGFNEDDPEESAEGILKLPDILGDSNAFVVSFRYVHPTKGKENEEFYFKIVDILDTNKCDVNVVSNQKRNEIVWSELDFEKDLVPSVFDSLDSWLNQKIVK